MFFLLFFFLLLGLLLFFTKVKVEFELSSSLIVVGATGP